MQLALVSLAVVVLSVQGPEPESSATPPDLELRLFVHGAPDDQDVARMREVTHSLIAHIPLAPMWFDCDEHVERCRRASPDRLAVQVLLFPHHKPGRPDVCGEAAQDASTGLPAIVLYVACGRDVTTELQWRVRDPRILTLEVGHVLGLTLVHELGHVCGLPHSPRGVMKARQGITDLLELRSSRLSLGRAESQRLAQAIRDRQVLYARHDPDR